MLNIVHTDKIYHKSCNECDIKDVEVVKDVDEGDLLNRGEDTSNKQRPPGKPEAFASGCVNTLMLNACKSCTCIYF